MAARGRGEGAPRARTQRTFRAQHLVIAQLRCANHHLEQHLQSREQHRVHHQDGPWPVPAPRDWLARYRRELKYLSLLLGGVQDGADSFRRHEACGAAGDHQCGHRRKRLLELIGVPRHAAHTLRAGRSWQAPAGVATPTAALPPSRDGPTRARLGRRHIRRRPSAPRDPSGWQAQRGLGKVQVCSTRIHQHGSGRAALVPARDVRF